MMLCQHVARIIVTRHMNPLYTVEWAISLIFSPFNGMEITPKSWKEMETEKNNHQ